MALGRTSIGARAAVVLAVALMSGAGVANAALAPTQIGLAGASPLDQALAGYDAAISADTLTPVAKLTSAVTLDGTIGSEFDFGASTGDGTIEFILQGDPALNISAYLAVGENSTSNLRYELWNNTGQLGFTQLGVADYAFIPGVPSPTQPTHVAYVLTPDTTTMKLYVNGAFMGSVTNVDANFGLPTGPGWLGANATGGEPMAGTIHRVTVYDELLTDAAIKTHAAGFTDVLRPPIVASFTVSTNVISSGASASLNWAVQNATAVLINGTDRTGLTNLAITPLGSTTYTLIASNSFGTASSNVRITVSPKLSAYDTAINTDAGTGLTPVVRGTNAVVLTGSAGVPFDFGATSGDVSIEFILEGDTTANASAYLAVGEVAASNLRYEGWENTAHLGFTQLGVADYAFTPVVPSPSWPTHVTYAWDSAVLTMKIYVNGVLAGTTTEVTDAFTMPSGQGWLGSTATGAEGMRGAIFRVTVYAGALPEAAILRHADAFMTEARPTLHSYDLAVRSGTAPLAKVLAPIALPGGSGVRFDFGENAGDATIEFVMDGNPSGSVSANLAVGTVAASLLRYEVWENTTQLGFTQAGVADYLFTPGVASPTGITHVTYRYDAAAATMQAYVNGTLAGSVTNVDATFVMPSGLGMLGANPDGTEAMVGTIHRVSAYDELLGEDVILNHGKLFASTSGSAPTLAISLTGAAPSLVLSQGTTGAHYRVEYRDALTDTQGWQSLQDIPSLAGTSITVTDPTSSASRPQRFYRAVQVQ